MAQSEQVARMRAKRAVQNVTGAEGEFLMHLGEYQTSYAGDSVSSSLGAKFVKHHDLTAKQGVEQFFDMETGALVVIPSASLDDGGFIGGDD